MHPPTPARLCLPALVPLLLGVTFADRTSEAGLSGVTDAAAAFGDYDNDGDADLLVYGVLWNNDGGRFTAVVTLPYAGEGLFGDFDNDGLLDIYQFTGTPRLYLQRPGSPQGWVFTGAGAFPGAPMLVSRGAALADYDNDGFLDIYIGGYENPGYEPDALYFGNGDGTFAKAWEEPPAGFYAWVFPGRGVTACDFDEDGDMDVYVSNYRIEANYLWVNDGSGTFVERGEALGVAGTYDGWSYSYGHTIGSAWGDLDGDGHFDLFVGNFSHIDDWQDRPMFLRNALGTSGGFQDLSHMAALAWQESFASPTLGDHDNDGDLDLYFTTVYAGDYPVLLDNEGDFAFTDTTAAVGLGGIGSTYQAAWADTDDDGDLDLLTNGRLFRNGGGGHGHWLKVQLAGNGTTTNAAAIGAQVRVQTATDVQARQVASGTGEFNGNDLTLHFGLGASPDPVALEIRWPDGLVQHVADVDVDQTVWIDQCLPIDADGDGFFDAACGGRDCDDGNPDTHVGAAEVCDDLDNDCNGVADDDAIDARTWYADADGDGYGEPDTTTTACRRPSGYVANDADVCPGGDDAIDGDLDGTPDACEPSRDIALSSSPWIAGDWVTLRVTGAEPGDSVQFVRGSGIGAGPCPPDLGGLCLDVTARVYQLGEAVADVTGVATYTFAVPGSLPPGTVVFLQAVIARGGIDPAKSPVVEAASG